MFPKFDYIISKNAKSFIFEKKVLECNHVSNSGSSSLNYALKSLQSEEENAIYRSVLSFCPQTSWLIDNQLVTWI